MAFSATRDIAGSVAIIIIVLLLDSVALAQKPTGMNDLKNIDLCNGAGSQVT